MLLMPLCRTATTLVYGVQQPPYLPSLESFAQSGMSRVPARAYDRDAAPAGPLGNTAGARTPGLLAFISSWWDFALSGRDRSYGMGDGGNLDFVPGAWCRPAVAGGVVLHSQRLECRRGTSQR